MKVGGGLAGLTLLPVLASIAAVVLGIMARDELRRVDFAGNLPDPFDDIAFHPIGIEGHRSSPLPERWNRGLIISPFIDNSTLTLFSKTDAKKRYLLSRKEELDCISEQVLANILF